MIYRTSIVAIFLMNFFFCHEVFRYLGRVVIAFFVVKTYVFFLLNVFLSDQTTPTSSWSVIFSMQHTLYAGSVGHTTQFQFVSVRMNCIQPPQQRKLNSGVTLTAHGRSSTQRNILPVRYVYSVAKVVYLGI